MNADRRHQLIKLIHVARRELQMDDDAYRQMLAGMPRLGGKTSAAELDLAQLNAVVDLMKAKGFKVRSGKKKRPAAPGKAGTRPLADDAQSSKIRSLWLELHERGAVRDPSEVALNRFVLRTTKVEALQWLSTAEASRVIEHLKKWLNRVTAPEVL